MYRFSGGKDLRVLMLSWEYPPRIVGGIARHVEEIAWALVKQDVEVHVVTSEAGDAPAEETVGGVHIHRVAPYYPINDFIHYAQQLNAAMRDRADLLLQEWTAGKTPLKRRSSRSGILLHVHDWLGHFAGAALKHQYKIPMIATIHATEFGRNNGVHTGGQLYIHSVEWQLVYESWRTIVCSYYMKGQVEFALGAPSDKLDVIYNGIHAEKFDFYFPPEEAAAFRNNFAAPNQKIIFFVGRMVREKGANLLIDAFAQVRRDYYDCKLVIVGGGHRDHLVSQARHLGISDHVYFTGFMPDDALLRLYKVIDVACYPSLYEPFGIVALEAMAAGVPVVVSDSGGLPEIVQHDYTGTVVWNNNVESLAWGLLRVLHNPSHARWMAQNAAMRVREVFNWDTLAAQTKAVYERVWDEYRRSDW